MLVSTAALWFFVVRRPPLSVVACQLDVNGQTQLLLSCPSCTTGSVVYFGDASAPIESGKAQLDLNGSLPPGENSIALSLLEPGKTARKQVVEVSVPFALATEWAGLNDTVPRADIVVHALPMSAVIMDGKAMSLDAFGRAHHSIDLTQELTGLAAQTTPLSRTIDYAVTPPGGTVVRGQLQLNLPIAPLLIEAPGERIVTQSSTFMLAGNTLPDAVVTVAGRPIAVDARGAFAQLMHISTPGETSVAVRASVPGHAPRLFPIQLIRTKSLKDFAATARNGRTQSYAALTSGSDDTAGWQVALRGRVVSVTERGYRRELQLAASPCVQGDCPITVRYAGPDAPHPKESVEVFGKVARGGPAGSALEPTIEADFFLNLGAGP